MSQVALDLKFAATSTISQSGISRRIEEEPPGGQNGGDHAPPPGTNQSCFCLGLHYNQSDDCRFKIESFVPFPRNGVPTLIADADTSASEPSQMRFYGRKRLLAGSSRQRGHDASILGWLIALSAILGSVWHSAAWASELGFERDILPAITKLGCNSAACHGSAAGRGGFRLSLFGAQPSVDYEAIVYGEAGRRLQLTRPADSLLLKKPTQSIDHEGGFHFDVESRIWQQWRDWIARGAPYGAPDRLDRIEVVPPGLVGSTVPLVAPLKVWGITTAGERRDVTEWAEFLSADPSRLSVSETGHVTVRNRGESTLTVRFAGHFANVPLTIPFQPPANSTEPLHNLIDTPVKRKLETLGLDWPSVETSSRRLRRLYHDLIGRNPTEFEQKEFEENARPDRWEQCVDKLLASEELNRYWAHQWSKWFRLASPDQEPEVAKQTRSWLQQNLALQSDWQTMISHQLLAKGDSHQLGQVGFYRSTRDPRLQAERFSEIMMGARLRCANCHDHPLDQWTQNDYHGLAAIFAKLRYGRVIEELPRGRVIHPVTSQPAIPQIPGRPETASKDLTRHDLTEWLFTEGRETLGRHYVNRVWHSMTGYGIVLPLDDWRMTNPPTHPELIKTLISQLERDEWQLRPLLRRIASSRTYQSSAFAGKPEQDHSAVLQRYLATQRPRPMSPEVLLDSVVDFFGIPEDVEAEPGIQRTIELRQSGSTTESLSLLGRCTSADRCQTVENPQSLDLRAALHWINGKVINQRLDDSSGWLRSQWDRRRATVFLIESIYRRILCRVPREAETRFWLSELASVQGEEARWQLLQDLTWSLMSSPEFLSIP